MIHIRYRYVHEDVDRHGTVRIYYWRRPGPKIRIREAPGTEAFARRYAELSGAAANVPVGGRSPLAPPAPGTLRWLAAEYQASPTFKRLDPDTQRVRRQLLDHCCREPVFPGSAETFAEFPVSRLTTKALRVLRDRRSDKPEAANGRVKALRALFKWHASESETANPARDLDKIKVAGQGFRPWTVDDIDAFETRHPVGSKARLAMALLQYTGLRRADVVELGRQHVREGWITKRLHKGRNSNPVTLEIPLLAELAKVIAASPCGDLTFLMTDWGRPFTAAGFGNWFRDRCDEAGLKGRSAHGLRKAAATIAAERGATAHQLMAVFGWHTLAQPERYTKSAARRRLAAEATALIVPTAFAGEDKARKR